jgi:hypothetical protein
MTILLLLPGSYMLPIFSVGNPTTSHIRSAANLLDTFSLRIGVFLRRYPIARVVVLLYMVRKWGGGG